MPARICAELYDVIVWRAATTPAVSGAQTTARSWRPFRAQWQVEGDCLMFGGQAAAAKVGWVSFAGANLCPKAEPKVPL
jgi:hypothetical protein